MPHDNGPTPEDLADSLDAASIYAEPPVPDNDGAQGEIFPGSPVTALGMHGKQCFYLDVLQQLQSVDNHTRDRIRTIFGGRTDLLMQHFPRMSAGNPPKTLSWLHEEAATAMVSACAAKGVWSAHERVRGLGAWLNDNGFPILHCGDQIITRAESGRDVHQLPGQIEGYVYPADVRAPKPAPQATTDAECRQAAQELLEALQSWSWAREDVDAHLLLGWIVAAMFGGALQWRPMCWITGDRGMGKSTLMDLIGYVMGGEQGIVKATDTTEAGIRQVVKQATLPVAIDEAEAEADNRRMASVIKLARQAASGGLVIRGGADHKSAEFRVRSCFLFASILIPELMDQDISRMAVLELRPFKEGAMAPKITRRHFADLGRRIRRGVLRAWPQQHETLESYAMALSSAGHSARGCDQFGTLLAMADLALHGGQPTGDALAGWASKLDGRQIQAETDESADWERMLNHLFSHPLDMYRGGVKYSVGEVIAVAANLPSASTSLDRAEAVTQLRRFGISVAGTDKTAQIEIANNHQGLAPLFKDTRWAGGVHRQSAKRIPGATSPAAPRTMAGARTRVTAFPLTSLPWLLEPTPAASRTETEPGHI
ncbi:MAG: hypothetical protein AAF674_16625 [Pseudomonadota bacterium]